MTVHFSIGTFAADRAPFPGLVIDDAVYDISTVLPGTPDTASLLQDWERNIEALAAFAADGAARAGSQSRPLDELRILPPVNPTGQLMAAGANYREHVIQMTVAHPVRRPGRLKRMNFVPRPHARSTSAPAPATPTCGSAPHRQSAEPTTMSSCRPPAPTTTGSWNWGSSSDVPAYQVPEAQALDYVRRVHDL